MLSPAPWGREAQPFSPLPSTAGAEGAKIPSQGSKLLNATPPPEAGRPGAASRQSIFSLKRGSRAEAEKQRVPDNTTEPHTLSPALSPDSAGPGLRLSELGTPPAGALRPQYAALGPDA
jgi:hypothetical protein